jgi:hypothetical protein
MTGINDQNIDQWLFNYFEGSLSPLEEQKVEMFIFEHPEFEMDMDAWASASVRPSKEVYQNAQDLKRKRRGVVFWLQSTAVLFLFSLFIAAYFLIQPYHENQNLTVKKDTSLFLETVNHLALLAEQNKTQNQSAYIGGIVKSISSGNNPSKDVAHKHSVSYVTNLSTQSVNTPQSSNIQSNSPFLSSSTQNGRTKTEELSTATSKLFSENSQEFFENILRMKSPETVPVQVKHKVNAPASQVTALKLNAEKSVKSETKIHDTKFSHKIKNMMNREIALRNLRDPMYIIPGLTQRDINFASTGGLFATRVQSFNRIQWPSKNSQSVQMGLAADGYVNALHGGVGIQINYSNLQAGLLQNYEAAITYSPKFRLGNNFIIEPALRFKMGTKDLNNTKVEVGEQTEWNRGNVNTFLSHDHHHAMSRLWYKDVGVGMMLNAKWFFIGANLDNIIRHNENIYSGDSKIDARAPLNFTTTLGTDYESFNKKIALSTYFVYQNFGKLNEAWLGSTFRYNWLTVGAAVSTGFDPAASIGLKFKNFMLTYSMDYTKNHIQNTRNLSCQLSLRFTTNPSKYGRKFDF